MSAEDLNGMGLTAKELLLEVRADVKDIGHNVALLVGQNLDSRLHQLEVWREASVVAGVAASADPTATAAGRFLEAGRVRNAKRIDRLEKAVWLSSGALAVIVFVANFLLR